MPLPNSYVQTGRINEYFEAMVNAEAPSRFSQNFMERLGFKGKNDRPFVGLLKEIGFIDADGKPLSRYFEFLDKSRWRKVVAKGVREAYSDLFALNKQAHSMSADDVRNKLRTLYAGQKSDNVIRLIAKTFDELSGIADFSEETDDVDNFSENDADVPNDTPSTTDSVPVRRIVQKSNFESLQYHINIVLPESRDQTVYDAIFRSLREHLG